MRFLRSWIPTGLLIVVAAVAASPQDPGVSIGGPILGFIQDDSGASVRPILGVSGASVLGQNLELPAGLLGITVSPKQDYAVAVQSEDGQVLIIRFNAGTAAIAPLPGSRPKPDLIETSPTGRAAALYAHDSRTLQLIGGLPDTPETTFEFDVSRFPGRLSGIAVSDDGKLALLNLVGDEGASLWVVDSAGFSWQVAAGRLSSMAFLPRRHDAVIADDATQEVFLLQNIDQGAFRFPAIVFSEDPRPFSGVVASNDGRTIFIAQHESDKITIVNLESRIATVVGCQCEPTGIHRLKGREVFRLNGLSGGPITVLDTSSDNPRISIIPTGRHVNVTLTGSQELQ